MKKITAMLNSPVKIAGFTACAVLLIGLIVFGTIQASAGINENKTIGMDKGVNVEEPFWNSRSPRRRARC